MSDLFVEPDATPPRRQGLGPVFTATYESDAACCSEPIVPGEDIRADGRGGWIHADDQCEAIALVGLERSRSPMCPRCWCQHAPGQKECS